MFNIPRAIADRFAEAVVRTANQDGEDDSGVSITPAPDGPTYPPRRDKGGHGGPRDAAPRSTLGRAPGGDRGFRSEEHTSEIQSLMRISYAVFCLKKKTHHN